MLVSLSGGVPSESPTRVTSDVYGAGDGVRSVECNGSTYPAAMRSRDGRLCFSTVDGVATIAPRDAARRNPRPPPVRLEAAVVDGRENPKRFTELHGGVVQVESEEGKGSTFRVVIPERAVPPAS